MAAPYGTPAHSFRELQRLAEAPLRWPRLVLVPFLVVLLGAVAASFLLPPRYRSSTLILVAPERMPADFMPRGTTESVTRRLQTLRQEVQSRTRLETVARDLDPYGSLGQEPLIDTIERMRSAVTVSVKGNDAFSIEFEHRDPKMAMLVADRLTTLFMEDVVGARERQVSEAYRFIESQMQVARDQLEQKEAALRRYKERYMGQLPEQVQANLATLQRLQLEQQSVADSLRKASDTLLLLHSGRSAAGDPPPAPAGASPSPDSAELLRAQLAALRTRYTDRHPDVKATLSRIATLDAEAATTKAQAPPVDLAAEASAQRGVREAELQVQGLREHLGDVDQRIAAFQARVEAAPKREQEILALTRDYQKLSENYTQLLSQKLDAETAARLEQRSRGQQFRVIDPAYLPIRPSFPHRGLFALVGALAGLLLGISLAVVADILDPTVKEADQAAAALRLPLLAVVPYVGRRDQQRLASLPDVTGEAAAEAR
jgi:polysaccharide chain length determinant protein (PEP-CTERM system associated)